MKTAKFSFVAAVMCECSLNKQSAAAQIDALRLTMKSNSPTIQSHYVEPDGKLTPAGLESYLKASATAIATASMALATTSDQKPHEILAKTMNLAFEVLQNNHTLTLGGQLWKDKH